jgi:hypothetical protein
VKVFAPQRFLTFNKASVEDACLALACLAARFSLRDFPDFLVIVCRGDLSDTANPLIWGLDGPDPPDGAVPEQVGHGLDVHT